MYWHEDTAAAAMHSPSYTGLLDCGGALFGGRYGDRRNACWGAHECCCELSRQDRTQAVAMSLQRSLPALGRLPSTHALCT